MGERIHLTKAKNNGLANKIVSSKIFQKLVVNKKHAKEM
jgi:hypothetical protein